MKRRDFLRAAGGTAAAATATAGNAAAAEGGGGGGQTRPDFGGWLDGVDGGYQDLRGQEQVTVQVGASGNGGSYAFSPAGIWIDPGTTVQFEWTGEGGAHNVVNDAGPADLNSGDPVDTSGVEYEFQFTEEHAGITNYICQPHVDLGMVGAVAVGEDVPTVQVSGGGGEFNIEDLGVPIQAHYVGSATILMILVSLVFTFYILKYGESPNTGNTGGGEK
jgi:halocyanin-like protein